MNIDFGLVKRGYENNSFNIEYAKAFSVATNLDPHIPTELLAVVLAYSREAGDILSLIQQIGGNSIKTIGDALTNPKLKGLVGYEMRIINNKISFYSTRIEISKNLLSNVSDYINEFKLRVSSSGVKAIEATDSIGAINIEIELAISRSLASNVNSTRKVLLKARPLISNLHIPIADSNFLLEDIDTWQKEVEGFVSKYKSSSFKETRCAGLLIEIQGADSFETYLSSFCKLLSIDSRFIEQMDDLLFDNNYALTSALLLSADLGAAFNCMKSKIYEQTIGHLCKNWEGVVFKLGDLHAEELRLRPLWQMVSEENNDLSYEDFVNKIWLDSSFLELLIENNIKELLSHLFEQESKNQDYGEFIEDTVHEFVYLKKRMGEEAVRCFYRLLSQDFFKKITNVDLFTRYMVKAGYISIRHRTIIRDYFDIQKELLIRSSMARLNR